MPFRIPNEESRRRLLCDHLGRAALAGAPAIEHSKCGGLHLACAPPPTPALPYGNLWTLINHLKVLHQYTELISAAASGEGPHALPLSASREACVNGLEWFAPLLDRIPDAPSFYAACQKRVDGWRLANPGLYSHAEAAYHVHQASESRDLARLLVQCIDRQAREYEVDIAGNILRASPASFDEFLYEFTHWRGNALYHLLCLSARNMPMASSWMPRAHLHESDDWQDLLTQFNTSSFCSSHRMEEIFASLWNRSHAMNNHICSLLDRVSILARVKSNDPSVGLDDSLAGLRFPKGSFSPFFQDKIWFGLRRAVEESAPPSLLCPALYPPNRSTWGFQGLRLLMRNERPYIHTGELSWIERSALESLTDRPPLPDRLHDILLRIGEAATAPEVAHLMLDPKSLSDALAGRAVDRGLLRDFSDRGFVLGEMGKGLEPPGSDFASCVRSLMQCLPATKTLTLPAPAQLLAWRVDCPPRAILYRGRASEVDLCSMPPHRLCKTIHPDKVANRTVSGISMLARPVLDKEGIHDSIRACIAEEVAGRHPSFSSHPHHRVLLRPALSSPADRFEEPNRPTAYTSTTLAEAVGVFTGPKPIHLSEVPLHGSEPWNEDHVDGRYAERQTADNGSRYRDWVTVYYDGQDLQRCRLASHEVRADRLYQTHLPLVGKEGQSWVSVCSTLPLDTVMLRHQPARTELESLKRGVDTRFMHDGKLLPVRHPGDRVDREHMEIYSDESAGQVIIAYAPKSEDGRRLGIEFVSFVHSDRDGAIRG